GLTGAGVASLVARLAGLPHPLPALAGGLALAAGTGAGALYGGLAGALSTGSGALLAGAGALGAAVLGVLLARAGEAVGGGALAGRLAGTVLAAVAPLAVAAPLVYAVGRHLPG
ncbi:MAG: hypothetical protein IRZ08_15515, partial [Frankia sp.]|nr:hypothetical protein [Frankia sp.]